ncbi:transcriptional regulator [Methanofollis formosanus]|uniref:Transcriptional regulator n=1 Tax=Methanofollis formosanus TaxID=299308 RepID=A0A8G1A2F8_9EURY|nr:zinc ribbon domain-containing protein [Methanofollis formosanus]QYZ78852.1 transcriptional regulator [Methanofollis formosanus]
MEEYEDPFCQSCGMPMRNPGDHGTEEDGSPSEDYCVHCYQQGSFVDPDITMEEMAEFCAKTMADMNIMPHDGARDLMYALLPTLKRWKT